MARSISDVLSLPLRRLIGRNEMLLPVTIARETRIEIPLQVAFVTPPPVPIRELKTVRSSDSQETGWRFPPRPLSTPQRTSSLRFAGTTSVSSQDGSTGSPLIIV